MSDQTTGHAGQQTEGLDMSALQITPTKAASKKTYIPGQITIKEISRNMLEKSYRPRRGGRCLRDADGKPLSEFAEQVQIVTLPAQTDEQRANRLGASLNRMTNRGSQQVSFQDLSDESPTQLLPYVLLDREGNLLPEFEGYGTVSGVVADYCHALLVALQEAAKANTPFEGTKTYTVVETSMDADGNDLEDEDDDGNPVPLREEHHYLLFARETPMIDEKTGLPKTQADRAEIRDDSIRYNGPKELPILPIGEVKSESGKIRTLCFGVTYAEQRNMERATLQRSESSISFNRWLFGLGLIEFNGTIAELYQKFPTKFPNRKDLVGQVLCWPQTIAIDPHAAEHAASRLASLRATALAHNTAKPANTVPVRRLMTD